MRLNLLLFFLLVSLAGCRTIDKWASVVRMPISAAFTRSVCANEIAPVLHPVFPGDPIKVVEVWPCRAFYLVPNAERAGRAGRSICVVGYNGHWGLCKKTCGGVSIRDQILLHLGWLHWGACWEITDSLRPRRVCWPADRTNRYIR